MEGISANAYRGIKGYWRRKGYERLHPRRKKPRDVLLGSGNGEDDGTKRVRRRFWKIRFGPRLKLRRLFSPKRFLLGLRDAYVNMMMRIASSRAVAFGGGYGYCAGDGFSGFGLRPMKEYDEKMIVEIYKSIVVSREQLVPRDAKWVGSEITACAPKLTTTS